MQLEELFDYKNQMMEDLLTNEQIAALLSDDGEARESPETLAYSQVYPCEYIPTTQEHGQTYICFDVDLQKSLNKTFYAPVLYVWIFTHKSKLRLPQGGLRVDKLASAVAEVLNGNWFYGLGQLELYSVKRFAPVQDYNGKVLTFNAVDFNRIGPNRKPIPENRKGRSDDNA